MLSALTEGLGEIKSTEKLDNELKNNLGIGKYELTGGQDTGWTVIVEDKGYVVDKNGEVEKTNWLEQEDGSIKSIDGKITLQIGDYVDYDPSKGGTLTNDSKCKYIAPQGTYVATDEGKDGKMEFGTGYENGEQEFTLDSNIQWKVMGIENGKIMLISANTLNKILYLRGQTGYEYGPDIIDKISKIYGYGERALGSRALTVDDINKITGYDPKKTGNVEDALYGKGEIHEYGNKVTYTKNASNVGYNTTNGKNGLGNYSMYRYYEESSKRWKSLSNGMSKDYKSNYYWYYPKTLTTSLSDTQVGIIKTNEYNTLFSFSGGSDACWLGSQYIYTTTGYNSFGIRGFSNGHSVGGYYLFYSYGFNRTYGSGIRPVVYLEQEVQLKENGVNKWTIVK